MRTVSKALLIFPMRSVTAFLHRFGMKRSSGKFKSVIAVKLHGQTISISAPIQHIWELRAKSSLRDLCESSWWNGADGISDIEGEAATGSGERVGRRAS